TELPEIGSASNITSAHLALFAGQAEAEINAQLAQRYALPLVVDVPLLTTLATDIAVYKVLTRRIFSAERLAASPWPDRYREAATLLAQIGDGTLSLPDVTGTVLPGRTDLAAAFSTTQNYAPTMWEGHTGDQFVDPQKIEDEAAKRDLVI